MPREIDAGQIEALLKHGHSQRAIARELQIPRTTVGRIVQKYKFAEIYQDAPQLDELIASLDDLKEMLAWWRDRKRAPSLARDADRETQRQTYHVQKRYIAAIRRAADLERVSIAEIVNRAFAEYFSK